jgi:RNA polymerase sigma-70 factor, ECF subfamily
MDKAVLKYQKELFSYAFFLTKNKDKAEDLLQDMYIRVFSKERNLEQIKNLKSYLMTIMYNIYIDAIRKKKLRTRYYNSLLIQGEPSINNAEANMNYKDIYNVIQSIRADWRESFLMYCNGFEYKEMSQEIGSNVETLRMRVFYAKQELRRKLQINEKK